MARHPRIADRVPAYEAANMARIDQEKLIAEPKSPLTACPPRDCPQEWSAARNLPGLLVEGLAAGLAPTPSSRRDPTLRKHHD